MGFKVEKGSCSDTLYLTAFGYVTAEDYEEKILPLFEKARSEGISLRLLIVFGDDFEGYTPGAAWEDAKLGLRFFKVIERCAVVANETWIRTFASFFGSLVPCTVASYELKDLSEAKKWLDSGEMVLNYKLDETSGVLNLEVSGPITSMMMEELTHKVDAYLESKRSLNALVIHAKEFPGWEDLGSMISHISFVKNHHKKLKRVALVMDGRMLDVAQSVAQYFVSADLRHFPYSELEEANKWARAERN